MNEHKHYDITLAGISYPSDFSGKMYYYVPVGILSLASYIKTKNFKTQILDYQLDKSDNSYSPQNIYEFLKTASSDIIGISVMTKDLPGTLIACEMLKKSNPEKTIILGGPGPTGSARQIMERFDYIDYIIRGEGEHTLSELMTAIHDKRLPIDINGLVYRLEKTVKVNPARCRIEELDDLPLPDYEAIDHRLYNIIYLPSTRGCRHFCTFCDQPALWQGKEVRRSLDSLFNEIDYITNTLKARWEIAFSDNEFCVDPQRFEQFSSRYREKGYNFSFSMDRRVDSINDSLLQKAREINCGLILYGVESGSGKVLKEIRKGFPPESIKPGLLVSSKYMVNSIASFMFSYPFETLEDFIKTAELIYNLWQEPTLNFITFQIHYLSPLPRTPIFEKYKDKMVRRRVSNLMVTKRNESQYDTIIDNSLRKAAVLPKKLDETDLQENPLVEKLILENPEICSGFYLYDSPGLHLKEAVIECLKILFVKQIKTALFILEKKSTHLEQAPQTFYFFFNGKKIIAAGPACDNDTPAVHLIIGSSELENQSQVIKKLKETGKQDVLIEFNEDSLVKETQTGDKILSLLESMRMSGLRPTLFRPVNPSLFRFTTKLKLQSQFRMPSERVLEINLK